MTTTIEPTAQSRENGGYVLRTFRESAGLTQQKAADLAGISRAHLGRLERGETETFAEGERCPSAAATTDADRREHSRVCDPT